MPILGVLSRHVEAFDMAQLAVSKRWGEPEIVSKTWDFHWSDYYAPQMGAGLKRRFLAFPPRMDPAELAEVKLWTNRLEQELADKIESDCARPVNLDPGYLNDSKLVLASAKDHAHRVYLSRGIFAEITLSYQGGRWRAMPWTYPDFGSGAYDAFFDQARAGYMRARTPCK